MIENVSALPDWVLEAEETIWAWEHSLSWRADASQATTQEYRKVLIEQTWRAYHE